MNHQKSRLVPTSAKKSLISGRFHDMAVGRGDQEMTTMDLLGRLKPWCDLRCQIVFMLLVRANLYPPGAWIEVGKKGWWDWLNQPLHVSKQERQLRARASMYLTITLTIQKKNIYVNNQMWANMPYMDRWRQTAQGSRHLLVAPGDVGMLSVAEMSGHIAFEHSFLRKRVGPFTRVQKEKSGGRQRSISWWRGFWNLRCNEIWLVTSVWLSMSFFRIVFRVKVTLYHLLETSWILSLWNKLSLFWDKYKNPRSKMIPWIMRV